MTCADISFLLSLYGTDVNTAAAHEFMKRRTEPIHLHSIADFEFGNAIRQLRYRHLISHQQGLAMVHAYQDDKAHGVLVQAELSVDWVYGAAEQLAARLVPRHGGRGMDLLHVAAAAVLKATLFLSFDPRQRQLAAAAGLRAAP